MPFERISPETALAWLTDMPLVELMSHANDRRWELHPSNDVTYVLDTNPNYTNVCTANCTFCSFYRPVGHGEAYTHTPQQVAASVATAYAQGATTVLLQGGHNPDLPLQYYLDVIRAIQAAAPGIHLHLFSPSEITQIAESAGKTVDEVLQIFRDYGCTSMPGGGAEILVESVRRKVSPKKLSAQGWLDVMRSAHRAGMKTSCTMMYGHLEEPKDVIEHLVRLRELQDETGGFYSFIPWSFKRGESPLSRLVKQESLPSYYLRIIAIARLMLDNIPNIQCSWFNMGIRAGQLGLYSGANDFGGLLIEENVLYEAQHKVAITRQSMLQAIVEAGFNPVQRTTLYERVETEPTAPLTSITGTMQTFERTKGTQTAVL